VGLRSSTQQTADAIANIDQSLYRSRVDANGAGPGSTLGVLPLQRIYDLLRGDDPLEWSRVREILPPWAFESA
jgi:hypothetical protein